jgi:hypothetical protein
MPDSLCLRITRARLLWHDGLEEHGCHLLLILLLSHSSAVSDGIAAPYAPGFPTCFAEVLVLNLPLLGPMFVMIPQYRPIYTPVHVH